MFTDPFEILSAFEKAATVALYLTVALAVIGAVIGILLKKFRPETYRTFPKSATAFAAKALPLTDVEISRRLEIPVRTTRQILYELTCVHLLSKVLLDERMEAYQVAVPPETLTPISVIRALQNLVPDEGLDTSDPVYQNLNRIWESAEKSIDNRPLIEMGVAEPPQESSRLAPPFSRQKRTPLFPSEK